jgi:hypothetical protein
MELLEEDESFLPELISMLGPDAYTDIAYYFGGSTIRIPQPRDIIRQVKRYRRMKKEKSKDE